MNNDDKSQIETAIRELAARKAIKFTIHGHSKMVEEDITTSELVSSLMDCTLLENYPDHKRGACCLVCGRAATGRYLHIVCTSEYPELVIITVYEPKFPQWVTPYERGMKT